MYICLYYHYYCQKYVYNNKNCNFDNSIPYYLWDSIVDALCFQWSMLIALKLVSFWLILHILQYKMLPSCEATYYLNYLSVEWVHWGNHFKKNASTIVPHGWYGKQWKASYCQNCNYYYMHIFDNNNNNI